MKTAFIDLRPYGYKGSSVSGGYIYCPYMPVTYETEEQLEECIETLQKQYEQKLRSNNVDDED